MDFLISFYDLLVLFTHLNRIGMGYRRFFERTTPEAAIYGLSSRGFFKHNKPTKSGIEPLPNRTAALNDFRRANPDIELDNSKLAGFPLFKLHEEKVVVIAVSDNQHPEMQDVLNHLASKSKIEVVRDTVNESNAGTLRTILQDYIHRTKTLIHPRHMISVNTLCSEIEAAREANMWSVNLIAGSKELEPTDNIVIASQRKGALFRKRRNENNADALAMFPNDILLAVDKINELLKQGEFPGTQPIIAIKEGQILTADNPNDYRSGLVRFT